MKVRFKLNVFSSFYDTDPCPDDDERRLEYCQLLVDVFNMPLEKIDLRENIKVICTAEQFATFIIERERRGFSNAIKPLKARIINDTGGVIDAITGEDRITEWNSADPLIKWEGNK